MEQLTREELDYLYKKPQKNSINMLLGSFIRARMVELMLIIGMGIFLWDKVLKYNRY